MADKKRQTEMQAPLPEALAVRFVRRGGEQLAILSFALDTATRVPASITAAEREVIDGVLRGESNEEIARARGCAPRTVANQLASIFRKLSVRSRSELITRLRIRD
jgi:DNA-binding CsgD family transcriptional regulator